MPTTADFYAALRDELQSIKDAGLFKTERIIVSPQGSQIDTEGGQEVINLCANNYLGLSSHPSVVEAAHNALSGASG